MANNLQTITEARFHDVGPNGKCYAREGLLGVWTDDQNQWNIGEVKVGTDGNIDYSGGHRLDEKTLNNPTGLQAGLGYDRIPSGISRANLHEALGKIALPKGAPLPESSRRLFDQGGAGYEAKNAELEQYIQVPYDVATPYGSHRMERGAIGVGHDRQTGDAVIGEVDAMDVPHFNGEVTGISDIDFDRVRTEGLALDEGSPGTSLRLSSRSMRALDDGLKLQQRQREQEQQKATPGISSQAGLASLRGGQHVPSSPAPGAPGSRFNPIVRERQVENRGTDQVPIFQAGPQDEQQASANRSRTGDVPIYGKASLGALAGVQSVKALRGQDRQAASGRPEYTPPTLAEPQAGGEGFERQ